MPLPLLVVIEVTRVARKEAPGMMILENPEVLVTEKRDQASPLVVPEVPAGGLLQRLEPLVVTVEPERLSSLRNLKLSNKFLPPLSVHLVVEKEKKGSLEKVIKHHRLLEHMHRLSHLEKVDENQVQKGAEQEVVTLLLVAIATL